MPSVPSTTHSIAPSSFYQQDDPMPSSPASSRRALPVPKLPPQLVPPTAPPPTPDYRHAHSPATSTRSSRSAALRPPPSPAPSAHSVRAQSEAGTARSSSNASSMNRRTNRSRALATLEGGGGQAHHHHTANKLRTVRESMSFVPFDSDEEDVEEDEDDYRHFVERTRAAALKEQRDRDRMQIPRSAYYDQYQRPSTSPPTHPTPQQTFPSAMSYSRPVPAPSSAYNFIDLDDDSNSVRTRGSNSTRRSSVSYGSPPSTMSTWSTSTAPRPRRGSVGGNVMMRAPVPIAATPGAPNWGTRHTQVHHIASAA